MAQKRNRKLSYTINRWLLWILLLAAAAPSRPAQNEDMNQKPAYTANTIVTSKHLDRDFLPDGHLNKSAWKHVEWVEFSHNMRGDAQYPEAATRVASRWSKDYIYFAFQCKYSTLNIYEGEEPAKERWELWNRDVAEVFLNPQPERESHYYEFEVAPNNQWIDLEIDKTKTPFNDASWDSHFDHATRIDPNRRIWTCEMRIPLSSMNARAPVAGYEWRVNFFRADGPGDDSVRRFMSWSTIPEGKTFHVPERFGILRLVR